MGENHSNGRAGDTLESLKAERQDLEKTVACVRQMTRDLDALTDQEELFDPQRIALCLKLKGPQFRRCVWKGFATPEAFQWHKEAMATQKVLGDQMLRDAAAFGDALVRWAQNLEKREKEYWARAGRQIVRDPVNHAASDGSRSQDNSAGKPGVLIYTNNLDTYSRYTGSQKGVGQLPSANVIFVGPDSMNNLYLATNVPGAVEPPTYQGASYKFRVTINQSESWYYYSAQDAQTKQESMAFNAISSLTPLMVGFSPAAGAGGDTVSFAEKLNVDADQIAAKIVTEYSARALELNFSIILGEDPRHLNGPRFNSKFLTSDIDRKWKRTLLTGTIFRRRP